MRTVGSILFNRFYFFLFCERSSFLRQLVFFWVESRFSKLEFFKIDSLSDWRGCSKLIQGKDTLVVKGTILAGIFVLARSFSLLIL